MNLQLNALQICSEAKLFGLTFDRKLSWKQHIKNLKKRTLIAPNLLNILNNKIYGPSSSKLFNVYKVMISSKLDYGASLYSTAPPSLFNTLEPLQKACLRTILKASPSSPVASLQALTGIPPYSTRRLLQAAHYPISDIFWKNMSKTITDSPKHYLYSIQKRRTPSR